MWGKNFKAVADFLLPRTCIVCGCRLMLNEEHICLPCWMDMPLTYFWSQSHNPMSDRFNALVQRRLETYEQYIYAAALFFYKADADYKKIPYHIKYQGDINAGRYFGRILGRKLLSESAFHWRDVDLIVPVPLHWTRQWKRGYNQAEIIASALASELGAPVRTDILLRSRRTETQTKLDIEGKQRNVAGAFSCGLSGSMPCELKHILLVDDVFTTGNTLDACFSALRSVFPAPVRISLATLAFVD